MRSLVSIVLILTAAIAQVVPLHCVMETTRQHAGAEEAVHVTHAQHGDEEPGRVPLDCRALMQCAAAAPSAIAGFVDPGETLAAEQFSHPVTPPDVHLTAEPPPPRAATV